MRFSFFSRINQNLSVSNIFLLYAFCSMIFFGLEAFSSFSWYFEPSVNLISLLNLITAAFLFEKKKFQIPRNKYLVLLNLITLYCFLNASYFNLLRYKIDILLSMSSYLFLFISVSQFEKRYLYKCFHRIKNWLLIFLSLLILFLIIISVLKVSKISKARLDPGFGNFGEFSMFLSLLYLLMALLITQVGGSKKYLFLIIPILIVIVINQTRIAAILLLLSTILLLKPGRNLKLLWGSVIFFAIFSLFVKVGSSVGRIEIWKILFSNLKKNVLIGNGINSFKADFPNKQIEYLNLNGPSLKHINDASYAFNEFLQVYFELGIFGLASLLFFFLSIFQNTFTNKSSNLNVPRLSVCCAIMLLFTFSFPLHSPKLLYPIFFLLLFILPFESKGRIVQLSQKWFLRGCITLLIICQSVILFSLYEWRNDCVGKVNMLPTKKRAVLGNVFMTENFSISQVYGFLQTENHAKVLESLYEKSKYSVTYTDLVLSGHQYLKMGQKDKYVAKMKMAISLIPSKKSASIELNNFLKNSKN